MTVTAPEKFVNAMAAAPLSKKQYTFITLLDLIALCGCMSNADVML